MTTAAQVSCSGGDRCRFRHAVAAHFLGRIDVDDERRLRAHLPDCAACRRFYSRALVLAGTDPRAPRTRERLARGLGLRGARAPWTAGLTRRWAVAVPAFAGLVLLVVRLIGSASHPALTPLAPLTPLTPLRPRGAAPADAPALLAYRISPSGALRAVERAIGGHDELAFAYSNPGAWPYLMVFAVDEHTHVYWYHPVWRLGAAPPAAIPARAGAGPFELPSATRHAFDGRRLVVYAVFARQPLGVEEIERAARAAGAPDRLAFSNDLRVVRRPLEVTP